MRRIEAEKRNETPSPSPLAPLLLQQAYKPQAQGCRICGMSHIFASSRSPKRPLCMAYLQCG